MPTPARTNINIQYADDITQIVSSRRSEKILALETAREIERLNDYENKWRIKTNQSKFQIISISKRKKEPVVIGGRPHPFDKSGKVLGVQFTTNGFSTHTKSRIKMAKDKLTKLYRFKQISMQNKKKLYNAYVKSILVYPTIPLHTASKHLQGKMQVVQNDAGRFMLGITKMDRVRSRTIQALTGLKPINIYLHEQAKKTWRIIDGITDDRTRQIITTDGISTFRQFPSSRRIALGPTPEPII